MLKQFSGRSRIVASVVGAVACVLSTAGQAADVVPADSTMAKLGDAAQRVLLAGCEANDAIAKASFFMTDLAIAPADASITPKVGLSALEFSGVAMGPGGKGDFTLCGEQPGTVRMLGEWVYLPADANIATLGIQVVDGEGEYLAQTVPADWTGWKWIEVDLQKGKLESVPGQNGKNGHFDQPLKSANTVWFSKKAGRSSLVVDGLLGAVDAAPSKGPAVRVQWGGSATMEPGQPFSPLLLLTNYTGDKAVASVESSIQQDPMLQAGPAPDAVWGTDHARGAKSWTVADGKTIEEGSLTDGNEFTGAGTTYMGDHWSEGFQTIDLGVERKVSHIRHSSGDANWCFKVDIAASSDGKTYTPVAGLQGVDWHAKWGPELDLDVPQPFQARYVRFRYHDDGKKHEVIRMPVAIGIYDGLADEKMAIASVGAVVATGKQQVEVPAHSFALVPLAISAKTTPGAYFAAARAEVGQQVQLVQRNMFVMPPAMKLGPESRFGMNTADISLAEMNARLGVGWIRFENAKWPFFTSAPGQYDFSGAVAPWGINMDGLVEKYKSLGITFLPTMFMTPGYLATEKVPTKEPSLYPPKDLSKYGEFTFQTVARYANQKHPAEELLTKDKKSGLGLVNVYELRNEPDMTNMDWGSWRGPFEQYLEMFRFGAEGVKKADPKAVVGSAGLSDYRLATVDKFRTYKYADGKTPLDFIDQLNVHHYTGRIAPEIATTDINIDRADDAKKGKYTYEQELQILDKWRKQYKPGMSIWMTEMGYDTGGPVAVPERTQAAYIVRNTMMAMANGIEKVFLFRESGSGSNLFWGSGVVRNDYSYKPSWFTYATLIRQLDGVGSATRLLQTDRNVWLYEWHRDKQAILTAWTVEGEGTLELKPGRYTITDAFGHSETRDVNGPIALSIFPVYISGIEDDAPLQPLHAESQHQEQIDRDRLDRIAHLNAYLFDFGSMEHAGTVEVGTERRCTPVLAEDAWNATKGYGFEPASGKSEVGGGTVNDAMEDDWVRLGAENKFRFNAKAGKYQMRIKAAPLQPDLHVTVTGIKGGPKVVSVGADGPATELDIETTGDVVQVQFDKYLLLKWMTVIEKVE